MSHGPDGAGFPTAPTWLSQVPFAHRGLHGHGVPENSLAAFAAAARAGYGVELDVHLTLDGVPVVVHDPSLLRTVGVDVRVGRITLAELGDLRLVGSSEHVPSLTEALEVLRGVPVMVDLKQPRPRPGRLEEQTAHVLDGHPGRWCVAGFNPVTIRWFRRYRPHAVRVLIATSRPATMMPAFVARRFADLRDLEGVAPHAVSYDLACLPTPATDAWRAAGGVLLAWTAVGSRGLARARQVADNAVFEHVLPPPPAAYPPTSDGPATP